MGMKIVFDFRMSGWSGIGRYSVNLVRELLKTGKNLELHLIGSEGDFKRIEQAESGERATKIHCSEEVFSVSNFIGTGKKKALRTVEGGYVLHVPHFTASISDVRDLVITVHDLMPLKYPIIQRKKRLFYYLWNLISISKAKKIITVSHFVKEDIKKFFGVPEGKITVIHLAPDEIFLNPELASRESPFEFEYALCFANWKFHKGLDVVIDSLEGWPDNIVLVMVGRQPDAGEASREIIRKVEDYRTRGRLLFVNKVDDKTLVNLYRHARFFLHPSREEGFGLPPLEAMALSTPVVASRTEVSTEVLKNAPLYFDSGSAESLARAVRLLLKSKDLQDELREKGRKLAGEYSWKKTAELTLKVYEEVMS